jgi:hypothetical protein
MGELDPRQLPPSLRVRLAIDALPEPRDPGAPTAREFTPAHKAFMKAAAQRYNVQDANVLTSLLGVAKNQLGDMAKLASLNTTPNLLAESLRGLLGTYQLEQRRPDAPALPANGMEIMLDLAVSLAGFDAAQIRNFAANMRGEDAAVVAGAVLNGAEGGLPGLPPEGRRNFRAAYDMMKALYTVSGIRENGQAGQADRHFSDIVPLHRVPGGSNGCMSILAQMAGPGISRGALALSYILPPFSQAEWNALLPITAKAGQGPNADLAAELLALAGQDLLAALAANGGRTLSNAQIWEAVTGGPMPAGVRDANFGERLSAAFFDGYMGSLRGIAPQIDDYRRDINARALIMTGGIRPRRLLELTRPGATLTLADIRGDMHMSSLNNYDAKTAYGLRTDFLRTPSALPMSFTDAQGNNHVTHRPAGGGHSNDTLEPQFQEIIGWVNGMTGNREIQTARVLQAFSQAPQITVSMYSNVFGLPLDINGNFSISATARADGRVLVEITHDPARGLEPAARTVPIFARMEFSINPDGSHDCTGLEMRRTDI